MNAPSPSKIPVVVLQLVLGLAASSLSAQVIVFDAAADFSGVSNPNPNGVWSQGYTATLGSALQLFDLFDPNLEGMDFSLSIWSSSLTGDGNPNFWKNNGPATQLWSTLAVEPGRLAVHPGPANEYAVLRFTTPTAGNFAINAHFFDGDVGETDAHILLNSATLAPVFSAPTTNGDAVFSSTLSLQPGDTLDFVVGTLGDYTSDTTPIQITVTPVPEPEHYGAFAGAGLLAFGLWRRHQRS